MCPAAALMTWLTVGDITAGPVFRIIDKLGSLTLRPLTAQSIGATLRERAVAAGVHTHQLSGAGETL